jgi:hypothetical protein
MRYYNTEMFRTLLGPGLGLGLMGLGLGLVGSGLGLGLVGMVSFNITAYKVQPSMDDAAVLPVLQLRIRFFGFLCSIQLKQKTVICHALFSAAGPIQSAGRNPQQAGTHLLTCERWRAELAQMVRPCEPVIGSQQSTRQPPTTT